LSRRTDTLFTPASKEDRSSYLSRGEGRGKERGEGKRKRWGGGEEEKER